jgi:FtsP/CotA-like multicopper oxidase with cupredoxin domain
MRPDHRVDTANVPPHGSTVIRFVYERPETAGDFVYHCHVLFHEDSGMMANVRLEGAGSTPAAGHAGAHP